MNRDKQRSRAARALILSASIFFLLLLAPTCQPSPLRFSVRMQQETFSIGEEPQLVLQFENVSSNPLTVSLLPEFTIVDATLRRDGKKIGSLPGFISVEGPLGGPDLGLRTLGPGESASVAFQPFVSDSADVRQLVRVLGGLPANNEELIRDFRAGIPLGLLFSLSSPSSESTRVKTTTWPLYGSGEYEFVLVYQYVGLSEENSLFRGKVQSNWVKFTVQ